MDSQWQHDPSVDNEVEVLFHAEGDSQTRVELEHRKIERYGEQAQAMYGVSSSERGWSGILRALADVSESVESASRRPSAIS